MLDAILVIVIVVQFVYILSVYKPTNLAGSLRTGFRILLDVFKKKV